MNETQPNYVSTLVVNFPMGMQRFSSRFPDFKALPQIMLFEEIYLFLNDLELDRTIFRSDHASNSLVLKGILNKDKERLMLQTEQAINHPNEARLRHGNKLGL
ncbi:MAG: hypothetical protein GY829_05065 [Gammaproteobacteria bacterium]|nr:hypothetical protein [Gammaproteobacteria bacterium]